MPCHALSGCCLCQRCTDQVAAFQHRLGCEEVWSIYEWANLFNYGVVINLSKDYQTESRFYLRKMLTELQNNKVTLLLSVKDNYHHCRQRPQRMRTQRKQRSDPEATSITTALCNQRNTSGRLVNHLTTSLLQKTKTPTNAKPAVCTVRTNPVKNQLSHKMIHSNWNRANPKLFHI